MKTPLIQILEAQIGAVRLLRTSPVQALAVEAAEEETRLLRRLTAEMRKAAAAAVESPGAPAPVAA